MSFGLKSLSLEGKLFVAEGKMAFKFHIIVFFDQKRVVAVKRRSFDGDTDGFMV